MAKAIKKDRGYTLTLELTQGEAEVLRSLTASVGGGGPVRDAVNSVWTALGHANVEDFTLFADSLWVADNTGGWENRG